MKPCEISIVMAVYNGEKYLRDTLDSIVSQSFDSFELIVIDDASTDSTPEILKDYAECDARIKVFRNPENLRLARSLNRGIGLAEGRYIVRMDADDICLTDRLECQYAYMESHPEIGVSFCKYFTLSGECIMPCAVGRECDPDRIKAMFLFFCPVLHPGVIAKSELIKKYSYDPEHTCSEDLDMWLRMLCDGVRIACSGDYLVLYRIHDMQITSTTTEKQKREVLESERVFYSKMLGAMSDEDAALYINSFYFRNSFKREQMLRFYKFIVRENRRTRQFSHTAIVNAVAEVLAEYRRAGEISTSDKLYFLRFGGIRLLTEITARKKQGRKDIENARAAAARAGFEQTGAHGRLPVYSGNNI